MYPMPENFDTFNIGSFSPSGDFPRQNRKNKSESQRSAGDQQKQSLPTAIHMFDRVFSFPRGGCYQPEV